MHSNRPGGREAPRGASFCQMLELGLYLQPPCSSPHQPVRQEWKMRACGCRYLDTLKARKPNIKNTEFRLHTQQKSKYDLGHHSLL